MTTARMQASQFVELPVIKAMSSVASYIVFLTLVVYSSGSESSSSGYTLSTHPDLGPFFVDYALKVNGNVSNATFDDNLFIKDVWVRAHHVDPETIVLIIWIIGL